MTHGGLWGVGKGDLVVVIASVGPGPGQTADLVVSLRKLGARVFLVADERVAWRFPLREIRAEGGSSFSYPAVPETLSPALAVLPVQLTAAFASHLLGRGTDPGRVSACGGCAHSPLAAAGSG
jgi:glucosamine 6-phosphate synthetase-like amidotransferase/phosphosugar isomerase protein